MTGYSNIYPLHQTSPQLCLSSLSLPWIQYCCHRYLVTRRRFRERLACLRRGQVPSCSASVGNCPIAFSGSDRVTTGGAVLVLVFLAAAVMGAVVIRPIGNVLDLYCSFTDPALAAA